MESPLLPQLDQLRDYGHAAAGHAGTLCDEDGKLFIKPCTAKEVSFYETVQRQAALPGSAGDKYRELQAIMPRFMGTLTLADAQDTKVEEAVAGAISQAELPDIAKEQIKVAVTDATSMEDAGKKDWVPTGGGKISTNTAIVLDNASSGFVKPNILDLKLGVRLYADSAPEQKKQRMDKITAETTHCTHGFRVAGMRVYRGSHDPSELDEDGFKVYDKYYGRNVVTSENVNSEIAKFVFSEGAGIHKELGKAVCRGLAHQVAEVEATLSKFRTRMFSASLLLVLEGDGRALENAIEQNNAAVDSVEARTLAWSTKRVDSGIAMDDDGEFSDDAESPMFKVRMIDFAHAEIGEPGAAGQEEAAGDDPHENLLFGIRTIKEIFTELGRE